MTKRRLLKISLGLLVVVGLFLAFAQRDRGPMVDGRPLEDWVQDLLVTAEPPKREAAQAAVAGLMAAVDAGYEMAAMDAGYEEAQNEQRGTGSSWGSRVRRPPVKAFLLVPRPKS